RSINAPVLLLHGTHDRLVPVASAREAAKRLPEWTFVELEAGHIPQMEVPDLVAEQILSWARSLPVR
ncbi:MAG: alpha/beta fold hydrolase, partial [Dehalococcoidia bacterium]